MSNSKNESKYYEKYKELKEKNSKCTYLFKKGNFYVALSKDAELLNKKLKLKTYNFSKDTIGVGFPVSSLNNYKKNLEHKKIIYKIVEFNQSTTHAVEKSDRKLIIEKISKLNLSQTTPIQAFNFLYEIQKNIKGSN